jgi:hypothetical protein
VKDGYEAVWGRISLEAEVTSQKTAYFEWGSRCSLAHAIGRKRVHQLCLARVIEWLQPSSVLEVGFGYGLNLLMLSMLFPSVSFSWRRADACRSRSGGGARRRPDHRSGVGALCRVSATRPARAAAARAA